MIVLQDQDIRTIEVILNQMPISSTSLVSEIFKVLNKNKHGENTNKGDNEKAPKEAAHPDKGAKSK